MDELRAMRTFHQVVASGSFAGAARALDVTPPAVTRAIAELERFLGTRLIARSTRRMALTPVGEHYIERVRTILDQVADANAMARQSQSVAHGPLRVIAPPAFATHQLARRLPRFHVAHPRITLELTTADLVNSPDEGHDISIVVRRPVLDGEFVARPLARSEVIACATPEYLDRHGRPRHPDDLAGHALILPTRWLAARSMTFRRQRLGTGDAAASEQVEVVPSRQPLACANHELHHASALAGIGIAGLASFSVDEALRERRLERVLPDWHLFDLSIWACMPSRRHVPASTRAFMDFLVEEFGGTNADPWIPRGTDMSALPVDRTARHGDGRRLSESMSRVSGADVADNGSRRETQGHGPHRT